MVTGLNHITLAVSDLDDSIRFYRDLLGCELVSRQATGAYLLVGTIWLCLSLDPKASEQERGDYTHIALSVDPEEFDKFSVHLQNAGVVVWKRNQSEGDSLYFLDPDNHKLEIHVGTLESRLKAMGSSQTMEGFGCQS